VSDEDLFHPRKTARQIVHTLIDVVSKNGTLLLNIPQSADGTIDEHSKTLLEEVGAWLRTCGEGIYGTRPWRVYGEGPTALAAVEGYNEADLDYSAADIRYTASGSTVYATLLGWPENGEAVLRSFGREDGPVAGVTLLGFGPVETRLEADGLQVRLPETPPTRHAHMLRIDRTS
jgi:alpha-L-fucosidase